MKPEEQYLLQHVFREIWRKKIVLASIILITVVAGMALAFMLPTTYRAEALLAPSHEDDVGGLSRLAAQYGGLASLAGISVPTDGADKVDYGIETLRSRKFIWDFLVEHDGLVPLFAVDGWDPATGEMQIDADVYDSTNREWVRPVSPPRTKRPSQQEAYDRFIELLTIERNRDTGFIIIAIEHQSPQVAKSWVDWLVEDLNHTVKARDVAEARAAIDYLNEQALATQVADLRAVYYELVKEQMKTITLAEVSSQYLFEVVDPAILPAEKAHPRRILIVFLSGVFGVFLAITFIVFSLALGGGAGKQLVENDVVRKPRE